MKPGKDQKREDWLQSFSSQEGNLVENVEQLFSLSGLQHKPCSHGTRDYFLMITEPATHMLPFLEQFMPGTAGV